MSQNPVDHVLVLDAGDDFDRLITAIANVNVDIECSLESLGPGHRDLSLSA